MSGMIGAMLVTVLVVAAYVAFRAINRDDLELEREPIDYLPVVSALQEAGNDGIAYPPTLPNGWNAVDAKQTPEGWALDLYTSQNRYLGLRQQDRQLRDMVAEFLDGEAEEGDEVEIPGDLGPTWQTFSDRDGDHAIATKVGEEYVVVFGSIDLDQIKVFAGSLTTEPLPDASAAAE
ncbi:hypothetical protein NODU109028_16960 [Nocardioides dubius]|uniref:DUF4245 domain-containing protein n=2 Tax=Nocardioides dubius TaxID=317019 RepID=A0ABP4EIC3_9ACTN